MRHAAPGHKPGRARAGQPPHSACSQHPPTPLPALTMTPLAGDRGAPGSGSRGRRSALAGLSPSPPSPQPAAAQAPSTAAPPSMAPSAAAAVAALRRDASAESLRGRARAGSETELVRAPAASACARNALRSERRSRTGAARQDGSPAGQARCHGVQRGSAGCGHAKWRRVRTVAGRRLKSRSRAWSRTNCACRQHAV